MHISTEVFHRQTLAVFPYLETGFDIEQIPAVFNECTCVIYEWPYPEVVQMPCRMYSPVNDERPALAVIVPGSPVLEVPIGTVYSHDLAG
jgi:hypothetical protein